jgi:hypothetical protein
MDIGIVRLMATVAISDDVKKQPLLANQQLLLTSKIHYIFPDKTVSCMSEHEKKKSNTTVRMWRSQILYTN